MLYNLLFKNVIRVSGDFASDDHALACRRRGAINPRQKRNHENKMRIQTESKNHRPIAPGVSEKKVNI